MNDSACSKKKLLFIYSGAVYGINDEIFRHKYRLLSQKFAGYVFVKSGGDNLFSIDRFMLHAISEKTKFSSLILFWKILRHVKRSEIGYIICYDPLVSGFIGSILKTYLNAKLIVEVNGVYTSKSVWVEYGNSFKAKIKKAFVPYVMKFVLHRANGIKLLFEGQIDSLYFKQNPKIVTFHDFVPLSFFKDLGEEKEILLVGFPLYIKGVDILIESFKRIAFKHPSWKLKILGHYPDKAELDRLIDGHTQIFHHPPVYYRDVPNHIGKCGILALPSRTEAMGRVLLEAAASKKARIASRVDGIPSFINDGVDGILVEPCDVEMLSEKLSFLIENEGARNDLGHSAFKRVHLEWSEHNYLNKYMKFIDDI